MKYIHLHPEALIEEPAFEQFIEKYCAEQGLNITLKGTLGKYPGCVHWHFKQGKAKGTLELTLWNKEQQLFFHYNEGRYAPWLDEVIGQFTEAIKAQKF